MLNKITYTIALLLITIFVRAEAYQLEYRVQCATSADENLIQIINKIPELNKFILPSGGQVYFSGQYFDAFEEANHRLQQVKSIGFKDAFIRVFKYKRMLSIEAGNIYIEKVKLLNKKRIERKIVEDKNNATVRLEEELDRNVVKRKTYTLEEINKIRAKRAADQKEKENILIEEEEDLIVDEAPVYKILLAKRKLNEKSPSEVKELTDEVVYTYQEGSDEYFAVGFYESSNEAYRVLGRYNEYADQAPEIIGLYKGRIVSLKLAEELHAVFKRRKI